MRQASIERNTRETQISVTVDLDGTGRYDVATGIGFLDHMLEQLSRHSLIDLTVRAQGDLHIDFHHTTEDTGIVIGEAVSRALGDRRGITRWGNALIPMDEALTRVARHADNGCPPHRPNHARAAVCQRRPGQWLLEFPRAIVKDQILQAGAHHVYPIVPQVARIESRDVVLQDAQIDPTDAIRQYGEQHPPPPGFDLDTMLAAL